MKLSFKISLLALTVAQASMVVAADKTWKGSAELGYNQTAGNSESTNMTARFAAERNFAKWLYNFNADTTNASSEGTRSAEKYYFSNRFGYKFSKHDYLFGFQSFDKDLFSGYEHQITLSAGYGRRVINNTNTHLDVEIGPGYRFAELENGDSENEAVARLFGKFDHRFNANTLFEQNLNIEAGSDNTTTRAMSALKVKMSDQLSMRLSYTIDNNSEVPAGKEDTDTETAVTVVYDF